MSLWLAVIIKKGRTKQAKKHIFNKKLKKTLNSK